MADERNKTDERNSERSRAIDLAFQQIEKQFGKGSIMRLGSKEAIVPDCGDFTEPISFDAALGVGGFPRGRVVEVFGPESSGKTTITLQSSPKRRSWAAWPLSSMPNTRSILAYAKKLGVDVDNLLVSQPDYGEQALEITEALVRSAPSTCWWSIRSPRSFPRPNWTAKWATATWACRRASCRKRCANLRARFRNRAPA
jgi:hypothetical protein